MYCLRFQQCPTLDCKDIGIRQSEVVADSISLFGDYHWKVPIWIKNFDNTLWQELGYAIIRM